LRQEKGRGSLAGSGRTGEEQGRQGGAGQPGGEELDRLGLAEERKKE